MKSQAMRKAWELYREVGVKSMAAWSESLRQAWKVVKAQAQQPVSVTVEMLIQSKHDRVWAARIGGKDAKFGFSRSFMEPVASERGSFKTSKTFHFEEGHVYEINDINGLGRGFAVVKNNELRFVSREYVAVAVA